MFSIEQIITTLSAKSRITSSSYSFQPNSDFSTRTCDVTLAASPDLQIVSNSCLLHSCRVVPIPDGGVLSPMFFIACLNNSLSSAFLIASSLAPINSTLYLSSTPLSANATARLRAVWPPMVGKIASGLSFAITCSTNSGVIGSMYVRSAISGSVMIVAGFELIRTTS
ncbi:hypothetical protein LXL04_036937 [Taraxacum kok-saghyz]